MIMVNPAGESEEVQKWDQRFLRLCREIASWSKDPSTQVGSVIVDQERRVVGLGYNGFPRGVYDSPNRYEDRELKYKLVVHAEANAILNSNSKTDDCVLYGWPLFACNECAKLIIQSGIRRVVSIIPPHDRWTDSNALAEQMFDESRIKYSRYPSDFLDSDLKSK